MDRKTSYGWWVDGWVVGGYVNAWVSGYKNG